MALGHKHEISRYDPLCASEGSVPNLDLSRLNGGTMPEPTILRCHDPAMARMRWRHRSREAKRSGKGGSVMINSATCIRAPSTWIPLGNWMYLVTMLTNYPKSVIPVTKWDDHRIQKSGPEMCGETVVFEVVGHPRNRTSVIHMENCCQGCHLHMLPPAMSDDDRWKLVALVTKPCENEGHPFHD